MERHVPIAKAEIMRSKAFCWTVAAALGAGVCPAAAQTDAGGDAAAGQLVAVQVRNQGLACAEPVSARRDPTAQDDAVWTLTCADATYRVRLVPDQAAQIEKLD
ncbi:MAG TPA: hypothetical protein VIZ90_00760 [Rhizobiaceae bacterium]